MKRMNKFDDILKDNLNGFEKAPSSSVWKGLGYKLFWLNLLFFFRKYLILFPIAAILVSVGLWLGLSQNDILMEDDNIHTEIVQTDIKPIQEIDEEMGKNSPDAVLENELNYDDKHSQLEKEVTIKEHKIDQNDKLAKTLKEEILEDKIADEVVESGLSEVIVLDVVDDASQTQWPEINDAKSYLIHSLSFVNYGKFSFSSRNSIVSIREVNFPVDNNRSKFSQRLSYSVNLNPEVLFGGVEDKPKMLYGAMASVELPVNKYLFQLGAAYTFSKDNGNYLVDWQQYDSIGYYYKVSGFEIDPETGQAEFETDVENIYDSIAYSEEGVLNHQYHYMNFHLLAGYRLYSGQKLSAYVLGGPVYSILLNADEEEVGFSNTLANDIKVYNDSKLRVKNNTFLSLSLGLNYKVSNKLSIGITPTAKIYNKSIYEGRFANKPTWTIGLRTGVIFKL